MTRSMLINGSSVIEKSRDSSGNVSLAHYLQIDTDASLQVKIPFDEYRKAYEQSAGSVQVVTQDVNVASPSQTVSASEISQVGLNLKPVLDLILEKLKVQDTSKITGDVELTIRSDLAEFLELPWESVAGSACVFREVVSSGSDNTQNNDTVQHFLIVKSHSYQPDKTNIGNDLNDEITEIFSNIVKNSSGSFRSENVHFLKHATKTNIESVQWAKFNFVHIALHGEADGRLCLEDPQTYDKIEHLEKEALVSILKGENSLHFTLVFLSFCFSGGGTSATSLAFDLVKEGLSLNTIGYSGGVGSSSAKKFAINFYAYLTGGKSPRSSFQEAFEKYRNENQTSTYMPMFYTKAI